VRLIDISGYLASGLVLVTFCMKDMVSLRIAALCSNVAFLVYGIGLELMPVVVLHGALVPINLWRLTSALRPGGISTHAARTGRPAWRWGRTCEGAPGGRQAAERGEDSYLGAAARKPLRPADL
jgi:hypothetical protein